MGLEEMLELGMGDIFSGDRIIEAPKKRKKSTKSGRTTYLYGITTMGMFSWKYSWTDLRFIAIVTLLLPFS